MGYHFSAALGFQDFCDGEQGWGPLVRHCGFPPSVGYLGAWDQDIKVKFDLQGPCCAKLVILSPGFLGVEKRSKERGSG
jgi:hypothetical protein